MNQATLEAEQQALKMKFVIAEAQAQNEKHILEEKAEAERQKIAAQGRSDAMRIDSQARADAKRIEGQAIAEYQQSLQLHLTDPILRYYQIEATRALANSPNSKLIYLGGGKPPETWLDLRATGKATPTD